MVVSTLIFACTLALTLALGWCLGAWWLDQPLLGAAGGVLTAIGGRIVWGRQGRVRSDENGQCYYPAKGLPSYEQLRTTAVFALEMAIGGWLCGVIGLLFYGTPGALYGATAGALVGFLCQVCEKEVVNAPAQLGTAFGIAAWDHKFAHAREAGIAVNPPNGIWLGLLTEEEQP